MNKLYYLLIGISLSIMCVNCSNNNTTAEVKITPEFIEKVHQYDDLYSFNEGLASVTKNGKEFRFYLNASNGTISLASSEKLYLR